MWEVVLLFPIFQLFFIFILFFCLFQLLDGLSLFFSIYFFLNWLFFRHFMWLFFQNAISMLIARKVALWLLFFVDVVEEIFNLFVSVTTIHTAQPFSYLLVIVYSLTLIYLVPGNALGVLSGMGISKDGTVFERMRFCVGSRFWLFLDFD